MGQFCYLHFPYKVSKFGPENAVFLEGKDNPVRLGTLVHDVHLREPSFISELFPYEIVQIHAALDQRHGAGLQLRDQS